MNKGKEDRSSQYRTTQDGRRYRHSTKNIIIIIIIKIIIIIIILLLLLYRNWQHTNPEG